MNKRSANSARDWVARELDYCLLNGWAVEFRPINGGTYLKIQISKCGKHAFQFIPVSTSPDFYMNIWKVINNMRQDILEEFPYVGT